MTVRANRKTIEYSSSKKCILIVFDNGLSLIEFFSKDISPKKV